MKEFVFAVCGLVMACMSSLTYADQVIYEPGPVDGVDMWLSSVYNQTAVDDWRLQAGGWGDEYRFFIKFDVTNLPSNPTSAVMWMLPYDKGDSSTLVGMNVDRVTSSWNESTTAYGQTSGQYVGSVGAPTLGYWYGINITGIYNNWKSGVYSNYGLRFRPVGTNNQFSQFYSSDLSSVYSWARPKLVVTYNGANLAFPLAGYTPYTVPISGVVDHSMTTGGGCADYLVVAYTGETGDPQYGVSSWSNGSESASCPKDILRGFAQEGLAPFSVNGQYDSYDTNGTSHNLFLFYDGHTGYDYPVANANVFAAASGTVTIPNPNPYDQVSIDHGNGFVTYYLHLSQINVANGAYVNKGDNIGVTSNHLHFTVKKNGQRVDPYGWKGEWGTDPLQVDGHDNVRLWENCQWW